MVCLLVVSGCGTEEGPPATEEPGTARNAEPTGGITGSASFDYGEPYFNEPIQMGADQSCVRMHDTTPHTEFVITGEGGGLKNVFVYLKSGLEGRTFPVPEEPVVLNQTGCIYVPHVFGIRVGQSLGILNSDETLHNIHAMPKKNKEFNVGQPVKGLSTERVFELPEVMVPFKCDVHKWMNSYAGVVDHPFFAVTDSEGRFALENVPAGDYVIEAWHERYGTREANVTVGEGESASVSFSFGAE